ncbi:MAG: TetR/AcrR family transcriptional regulator [Myxococcales bacterium]|nr:TetR/AcrR family transcriptional regulator [Myxococcales bacterium]
MPDDQENPTDAPARTRLAPDDRRQQLVETAAAILGSEGVEQVRVPRVADEAGVSRPVVYRFFPNRHALILAVLEDFRAELESRLPTSTKTPPDDLFREVRVFVDAACGAIEAKGPGAWYLMGSNGLDPELNELGEQLEAQLLEPWLPSLGELTGVSPREAKIIAKMVVAAARAVIELWIAGQLDREELLLLLSRGISGVLTEFLQ